MLKEIHKFACNLWWLVVIASVASIVFGIAALFMPGLTIALIVDMFAVLLVIIGTVQIVEGFVVRKMDRSWWISLLLGLFMFVMGIYFILHPAISILAFIIIVGWVLIGNGMLDILIGALKVKHKAGWILSGIVGIIAGIVVLMHPGAGTLAVIWILGFYALINGVILLVKAFSMRIAYTTISGRMHTISGK